MRIINQVLSNLKEPNSKDIIRIGRALHALTNTLTGASFLMSFPKVAMGIFITGALIQFVLDCLTNNDQSNNSITN